MALPLQNIRKGKDRGKEIKKEAPYERDALEKAKKKREEEMRVEKGKPAAVADRIEEEKPVTVQVSSQTADQASLHEVPREVKDIERILEEDLGDMYLQLDPALQQQFKKEGEQTASRIAQLLHRMKIRTKVIIDLIKNWLSIIPGVNKFFLEQEAKIKADKIVEMHEHGRASENKSSDQKGNTRIKDTP